MQQFFRITNNNSSITQNLVYTAGSGDSISSGLGVSLIIPNLISGHLYSVLPSIVLSQTGNIVEMELKWFKADGVSPT